MDNNRGSELIVPSFATDCELPTFCMGFMGHRRKGLLPFAMESPSRPDGKSFKEESLVNMARVHFVLSKSKAVHLWGNTTAAVSSPCNPQKHMPGAEDAMTYCTSIQPSEPEMLILPSISTFFSSQGGETLFPIPMVRSSKGELTLAS